MALREDSLVLAAYGAARETSALAEELRHIVEASLPRNASAGVRTHLLSAATRLDSVAAALNAELDRPEPDEASLGLLARLSQRAAQLLLAGGIGAAIVSGGVEGMSSAATEAVISQVWAVEASSAKVLDCYKARQVESAPATDNTGAADDVAGGHSPEAEAEAEALPTAADREFGPGGDYRGQDLGGADFAGLDLAQADFSDSDLTGADFSGADLSAAILRRATLVETRFEEAILTDAQLYRVDASGASFRGSDLTRAGFVDADLTRADFRGAELATVDLTDARIDEALGLEEFQ
jgi:hypothetical protein